jgi:hypothetical protein
MDSFIRVSRTVATAFLAASVRSSPHWPRTIHVLDDLKGSWQVVDVRLCKVHGGYSFLWFRNRKWYPSFLPKRYGLSAGA